MDNTVLLGCSVVVAVRGNELTKFAMVMLFINVAFVFAMWFLKIACVIAADVARVVFKCRVCFVAMCFFLVVVQDV